MPYWANFDNFRFFAMICSGNLVLALILTGLGFFIRMARQGGFSDSLRFGAMVLLLPLVGPAFLCAMFVTSFNITQSFLNEATMTTGQVIDLAANDDSDGGTTYAAIVEFTTADGQTVQFEDGSKTCNPPCNKVGDTVPVRYRVNSPKDAIISGGIDIWLVSGILGLLTVGSLIGAAAMVWAQVRRQGFMQRSQAQPVVYQG